EISSRRIVAARMQHDDRVAVGGFECGSHFGEVDGVRRLVVIGISAHREARAFEQRAMIFPGRSAYPDLGSRKILAQKIGGDLERSRSPESLHGHHAS